jgi:hypothetical protein
MEIKTRFESKVPVIMEFAGKELIEATKPLIPYDPEEDGLGHLEDSGETQDLRINFMSATLSVIYSNIDNGYDYAAIQEKVPFSHPVKGEVRYSEKATNEFSPIFERIVVEEINSL